MKTIKDYKNILENYNPSNPCLKVIVKALIVTQDDKEIIGSNDINRRIDKCPRVDQGCKTGEGYHLCAEVCHQNSHAEVTAIENAKKGKIDVKGAKLYLTGHTYCCDNCLMSMQRAGISYVHVFDSGKEYFLDGKENK
jgi:deoxycytidylate deaminase